MRIKDQWNEQRIYSSRTFAALVIIGLCSLSLLAKLLYLQVIRHDYYLELSQGNRVRQDPIPASRGLILDRNGRVLVDNEPAFQLELIPEQTPDLPGTLQRLADLKLLDPEDIAPLTPHHPFAPRLRQRAHQAAAVGRGNRPLCRASLPVPGRGAARAADPALSLRRAGRARARLRRRGQRGRPRPHRQAGLRGHHAHRQARRRGSLRDAAARPERLPADPGERAGTLGQVPGRLPAGAAGPGAGGRHRPGAGAGSADAAGGRGSARRAPRRGRGDRSRERRHSRARQPPGLRPVAVRPRTHAQRIRLPGQQRGQAAAQPGAARRLPLGLDHQAGDGAGRADLQHRRSRPAPVLQWRVPPAGQQPHVPRGQGRQARRGEPRRRRGALLRRLFLRARRAAGCRPHRQFRRAVRHRRAHRHRHQRRKAGPAADARMEESRPSSGPRTRSGSRARPSTLASARVTCWSRRCSWRTWRRCWRSVAAASSRAS